MKFVYVSCCDNGLFGLHHLVSRGHKPEFVVTIRPELGSKYAVSGYVDFSGACKTLGIKVVSLNDYSFRAEDLPRNSADILIVNGWNRLIPSEVIAKFKHGGVGIHAGHPPIGLGRAPLPWSLIKGLRSFEVYVFRLTERADDGDILAFETMEITLFDSVKTLYEKVMLRGALLFEKVLQMNDSSGLKGSAQNLDFAVHFPKRTPEDGKVLFSETCESLYNFIRAQTRPYPGAFFSFKNEIYRLWSAIPFDSHYQILPHRHPGKVIVNLPTGPVVQTGTTGLWLTEITDSTGKNVTARADLFCEGGVLE